MLIRLMSAAAVVLVATAGCGANKPPAPAAQDTPAPSAPNVAPSTTTSPVSTASAPAPGTVLQHLSGPGRLNVITGGAGFTFVDSFRPGLGDDVADQSVITAYDAGGTQLARIGSAGFTGECGAADVVVGERRTLLTELITDQPARGVEPALSSLDMDAWDAVTGAKLWHKELVPPQRSRIGCTAYSGELEDFAATHDGKWGLYSTTFADVEVHEVIDLATGQSHSVPAATGVLGNYLIHSESVAGPQTTTFFDPADGKTVARAEDRSFGNTMKPAATPLFGDADGLTADGAKVVLVDASADGAVVVADLPGLHKVWSVPASDNSYRILGDAGGTVLVDHSDGPNGDRLMIAYADDTGKERWRSPGGQLCGLTASQLLLAVNDQLAVLDMATGKQLAYSDAKGQGSGCPTVLAGGIAVSSSSEGLDVTQMLRP
jgi:hypothetical protein